MLIFCFANFCIKIFRSASYITISNYKESQLILGQSISVSKTFDVLYSFCIFVFLFLFFPISVVKQSIYQ